MKPPIPRMIREVREKRINRAPSPLLATITPWLIIMLGSLVPLLPLIASAPIVPPLGFLLLLAWLQLRPGVLPPWAGFPLGLFDDLFSGQPLGSAGFLWSISVLALALIDLRVPWRSFVQNWLIAGALIVAYLLLSALFVGTLTDPKMLIVLLPQIFLSVLLMPLVGRFAALFDRFRLFPIRNIG